MTSLDAPPPPAEDEAQIDKTPGPRSDLADAAFWIVLGVAVLIGSFTMDRLERQGVNPYTVPGLLPGLLGIAMMALGGILALRSLRRGALIVPPAQTDAHVGDDGPAGRRRAAADVAERYKPPGRFGRREDAHRCAARAQAEPLTSG